MSFCMAMTDLPQKLLTATVDILVWARLSSTFDSFDVSVVLARSNLNFSRISENLSLLGFDPSRLQ